MNKQLSLNIYRGTHGGRRPNSGKKRIHSKGVSHTKRELVKKSTPIHINFKFRHFLRTTKFKEIFDHAVENASIKNLWIRIYAIESNHIHIIAETDNNQTLESGMRSLLQTIVKRLDKGPVQLERYHLHVLKTPHEVRNAVRYVRNNHMNHTGRNDKKFVREISAGECWLLKET